jgi:parallel beta-helix repeat protein
VLERCSRIRIERNSTSRDNEGIVLLSSVDSRIAGNVSFDNINGIGLNDSDRNVIEANVLSRNENGIYAVTGSDYNVFKDNVATRNSAGGIEIDNGHNLITRNVVRDNFFVGIAVVGGDDNRIDQNSISANGDGSEGGIHLLSMDEDTSDRNLISNNSLISNVGDGILVDRDQTQTVIEHNVADKNTDDGIDTDSTSTTLSRNTADRNQDLGFEAVPGVRDGGGNKASFNGNPLQCTNLTCRRGDKELG